MFVLQPIRTCSATCTRQAWRSLHCSRPLFDAPTTKVPVSLIAELRKTRPVPMSVAREALSKSDNDLARALEYLESNSASAEKKASKVAGRDTTEGTIAVSLLSGKRVAMAHLACETDFVARNDVFLKAAKGIAGTAAFLDVPSEEEKRNIKLGEDPIQTWPTSALLSAPLIALPDDGSEPTPVQSDPTTIQQTLLSALHATGENLRLLRTVSFAAPFPSSPEVRYVPGVYSHGGSTPNTGRVGSIAVLAVTSADTSTPIASMIHGSNGSDLETALLKLARDIARQIVGFPTKAIDRKSKEGKDAEEGEVLIEQEFMMIGDERKVGDVLKARGEERGVHVRIVGMRRWSAADTIAEDSSSSSVEGTETTQDTVDGA
ncbi:hypothetical protein BCR39DRAFT_518578 [Naematelia encephala]|uniref:Elongation factor Ts, mitochondrial n=1 Tax=Naematelia encephala TaxID=71784 RepID=A0A1Y2BFU7_9TREE|nr:hypothetical protein BCR39DRAFT_518578 [Naematelia encephala]